MATKRNPSEFGSGDQWSPNELSFAEGRPYVEARLREAGLDPDAGIFTSRDPKAKKAMQLLETMNSPRGFRKWQLPFSFFSPTNLYITMGEPGVSVRKHSHNEGAGMRFILQGSLSLNRKRLDPGEWAYIPRGEPYSLKVGPEGVRMLADYAC